MKPLISVIVPVYNVAQYLRRFFASILQQTFSNFELIAVDDNSTDNSLDILKSYAHKDKRIKIVHLKHNVGCNNALNQGIVQAQGETLVFADPDDALPFNSLQIRFDAYHKYNALVVGGYEEFYNGILTRFIQRPSILSDIFSPRDICSHYHLSDLFLDVYWNKLFPTHLLHDHNIYFPENCRDYVDNWFLAKLFYHINRCVFVSDIVYYYHKREQSLTTSAPTYDECVCGLQYITYFVNVSIKNSSLGCIYSILNGFYVAFFNKIILALYHQTFPPDTALSLVNKLMSLSNDIKILAYLKAQDVNFLKRYCGFNWFYNFVHSSDQSLLAKLEMSKRLTYAH
ncbi:MAG: glycosyltransferase family 2 protein [Desulfovibrionaceae bacterium]|nr:glycosyltransferase family 2 protein [Desulfovibrionaceae bacterium]